MAQMTAQIAGGFGLALAALAALGANVHYHDRMLSLPAGSVARRRASHMAQAMAIVGVGCFIAGMVVISL